jgi:hypothetical protein
MPFLADSIEPALIRLNFRLQTGQSLPGFGLQGMPPALIREWRASSHWVWEQSLLFSGVLAIAGFFPGRRQLPGWVLTTLLMIAWLGAYEAGPQLGRRWFFPMIARVNGRPIGETVGVLISSVMYLLPRFVLYSVSAVAAVRDIRRDGRARPTWLEWTGLGLASALFLIAEPTELVWYYSVTRGAGSWATETLVRAATMLVAIVLGFFLSSRFGTASGSLPHRTSRIPSATTSASVPRVSPCAGE